MPVINRPYVIDLTPPTSFVGALQAAGLDTFVLDWGRPGLGDRKLGLDSYATKLLPRIEKKVLALAGAKELVLAGYCLGGVIAVCRAATAAARGQKHHAGLITIHAPVSFADSGPVGALTRPEYFPVEKFLEAFGNMPGPLLQQGFYYFRPLQNVSKFKRLFEKCGESDAVEEFVALEKWNSDNVPVAGRFYETLIKDLYRADKLAKGELELAGERVRLDAIRCPVLVLVAKDDPICLPHQAEALLERVSSADKQKHELTGGHVRSLTAPKARHKVAREIASWVASQ
jgi:polyhydroxyalkanoate synthase